jgi:hypothetical protein
MRRGCRTKNFAELPFTQSKVFTCLKEFDTSDVFINTEIVVAYFIIATDVDM